MQHKKQMKENNAAILSPGEKIHVIHRRYFEKDARRHFVGEVESYEHGIARASGYVFVVDDLNKHMFVKRPDRRTKLIPISSGEAIVNVIPESVDVERVAYELKDRALHVTDGNSWRIDVKEFGWG
jgi:hypothetical protein